MASSAGQPIATRAQGFVNSLVGRISGYNPFPAATGGAVPQTISIDGMFNKWSGIGLGAWLYGMLPVKQLPQKSKAKTLGKRAKRHPFLYYYDENGVFRSKRITRIEAWFRKFQKKKRFKFTCSSCDRSFMAINQKKKDIRCPYCD